MKPIVKRLLIIALVIIILKTVLISAFPGPVAFSDNYHYIKAARSLAYEGEIARHGFAVVAPPPAYTIALAPAYLLAEDMEWIYFFMKFLNVLMTTAIIIPLFLLAKELFEEKKALKVATLISIMPFTFIFPLFIMAENLSYTLIAFWAYFLYKACTTDKKSWFILTGLLVGAIFLTKLIALIVFPATAIVLLIKLFKDRKGIGNIILSAISSILIIAPWFIRNKLIPVASEAPSALIGGYTLTIQMFLAEYMTLSYWLVFFPWLIMYLAMFTMETGFLFTPFIINQAKDLFKKSKTFYLTLISLTTFLGALLIATTHFSLTATPAYDSIFYWVMSKPMGRYAYMALPLLMLLAFKGAETFQIKTIKKYTTWLLPIMLIGGTNLIFFSLFPVNNLGTSWLGSMKVVFDKITTGILTFRPIYNLESIIFFTLFFLLLWIGMLYIVPKLNFKKLLVIGYIIFIMAGLTSYGIAMINNYQNWDSSDDMQAGKWLNKYDPEISWILFDEESCGKLDKDGNNLCEQTNEREESTIMGVWLNDEIRIGSVKDTEGFNFIISNRDLKFDMIKQIGEVRIYEL